MGIPVVVVVVVVERSKESDRTSIVQYPVTLHNTSQEIHHYEKNLFKWVIPTPDTYTSFTTRQQAHQKKKHHWDFQTNRNVHNRTTTQPQDLPSEPSSVS